MVNTFREQRTEEGKAVEEPSPGYTDMPFTPKTQDSEDNHRKSRRSYIQASQYQTEESKADVRHLEQVLLGHAPNLTRKEAAKEAGIGLLGARKIWRALGFPNLRDGDVYFTEQDSEALRTIAHLNREYDISEDAMISVTRSIGQMMDRMVAWQIEAFVEDMVRTKGYTDREARQHLLKLFPEILDELEELATYGFRRQLNAAVLRLALRGDDAEDHSLPLARGIGFADLVSYTSLSREMNEQTLADLVKNFEQRCAEVVAVGGGRIIKTVGDEVLFLTETPEAAARISLTLSKLIKDDKSLPEARVAFVWGRILPRLGDVYGPTVNLAARLVALAEPGVVLTDSATAEILEDNQQFVLIPQGVRNVRGFGNVRPVALTPGIGNELEIGFE